MRPICDLRGDLDAAVYRTGSEQQNIRLGAAKALAIHSEKTGVFMNGWEQAVALALELDAEHVNHVAAGQNLFEPVGDFHAELRQARGTRVGGPQTMTCAPSFNKP